MLQQKQNKKQLKQISYFSNIMTIYRAFLSRRRGVGLLPYYILRRQNISYSKMGFQDLRVIQPEKSYKYDRMKMKMSMVSLVFSFIFDFLHAFQDCSHAVVISSSVSAFHQVNLCKVLQNQQSRGTQKLLHGIGWLEAPRGMEILFSGN